MKSLVDTGLETGARSDFLTRRHKGTKAQRFLQTKVLMYERYFQPFELYKPLKYFLMG